MFFHTLFSLKIFLPRGSHIECFTNGNMCGKINFSWTKKMFFTVFNTNSSLSLSRIFIPCSSHMTKSNFDNDFFLVQKIYWERNISGEYSFGKYVFPLVTLKLLLFTWFHMRKKNSPENILQILRWNRNVRNLQSFSTSSQSQTQKRKHLRPDLENESPGKTFFIWPSGLP